MRHAKLFSGRYGQRLGSAHGLLDHTAVQVFQRQFVNICQREVARGYDSLGVHAFHCARSDGLGCQLVTLDRGTSQHQELHDSREKPAVLNQCFGAHLGPEDLARIPIKIGIAKRNREPPTQALSAAIAVCTS